MNKRIIQPGVRRANSLGQLDKEFDYGPSPLDRGDVPVDLLPRYIEERRAGGGVGPGGAPDLSQLVRDVHYIAGVITLRRGLLGRVVSITSTPTLIINNSYQEGRGYLLLNPAGAVGLTATGTLLSSTVMAGALVTTTGSIGVANYLSSRFFVMTTYNAGAGNVTVDFQSKDPVTGTFITTQTVVITAANPNQYVSLGQLGVDTDLQAVVTVPGGTTVTMTIGFVLKEGLPGTSAGASQSIFIGGPGVSTVAGYPLLSGQEKQLYLLENVQLYAVTNGPTLNMNIFEL